MNKQIEEMAADIKNIVEARGGEVYPFEMAAILCEQKGYRKQSRGKWIMRGNEKTCSLCKFIYYSNNDEWNFCSNCGAKMKGGAE